MKSIKVANEIKSAYLFFDNLTNKRSQINLSGSTILKQWTILANLKKYKSKFSPLHKQGKVATISKKNKP